MKQSYLDFLRQNRTQLTEQIDIDGTQFLNNLLGPGVITMTQLAEIQRGDAVPRKKVERLLDCMERRTDKQFEQFCKILSDSEQDGAKEILEKLLEADHEKIFEISVPTAKAAAAPAGASAVTEQQGPDPRPRDDTVKEADKKERFRGLLMDHWGQLVKELNADDGLLDYLLQARVLEIRIKRSISKESQKEKQNTQLLEYIHDRPFKDMEAFNRALCDNNQHHLAKLLE